MKNICKRWYLIAACLLAAGLVFGLVGCIVIGFDFEKLESCTYTTQNTVIVFDQNVQEKEFSILSETDQNIKVDTKIKNLALDVTSTDVNIFPTEEEHVRIEAKHSEYEQVRIRLDPNGTLSITVKDSAVWYQKIGFHFDQGAVTVYLPQKTYENLSVKGVNGRVNVAAPLNFYAASLYTVNGDVELRADVRKDVDCRTKNGLLLLADLNAQSVKADSTNGEVLLMRVFADAVQIDTVNGDVKIVESDFDRMQIETVNGDVRGEVKTPKDFDVTSVNGNIILPDQTAAQPTCRVKTVNGDIEMYVVNEK